MDARAGIQKLIQLSIQKLHIMQEKSQLIDDEKYFTEKQSLSEIDAAEQIKGVLEQKLLALDIEFLKFYENVLEREGISNLSDIDTHEHPALKDLKETVEKIKSLESQIESSEESLAGMRSEQNETLSSKFLVRKQGRRVADTYKKQMTQRKSE